MYDDTVYLRSAGRSVYSTTFSMIVLWVLSGIGYLVEMEDCFISAGRAWLQQVICGIRIHVLIVSSGWVYFSLAGLHVNHESLRVDALFILDSWTCSLYLHSWMLGYRQKYFSILGQLGHSSSLLRAVSLTRSEFGDSWYNSWLVEFLIRHGLDQWSRLFSNLVKM